LDNLNSAKKVLWLTASLNIFLSVIKIAAGVISHSSAMISDGFHSLSDVITTFFVITALKISTKAADSEHPYGHERFEPVFAKIVSIILIITGAFLGLNAVKLLIKGNFPIPGMMALYAAILSILVKDGMYWYTIYYAKKIDSLSMEADAWHHRSDSLSSIAALVGIAGARVGFAYLDPLAAIFVSGFIIKVGVEFYLKAVDELVDKSVGDETLNKINEIANSVNGVIGIKDVKTRFFGNKIYIDMEIYVDGDISVRTGHDIATKVHDIIEKEIVNCKHCFIHVDPM